jgi:hypothetical protein
MTATQDTTTNGTQTPVAVVADAEQTQEQRFKWRTWVHYGTGAAECEHGMDGQCKDIEHFHALCRLPTPFQIRDIHEKAAAAKARRLRMLRDEDSDPRVILEDELDGLKFVDKGILVDELLDEQFTEHYVQAVKEVDDIDDPDHVPEGEEPIRKLYENIDQDREEYMRQRELPEDERDEDFEELERVYAAYSQAISDKMDELAKPRRDHLTSLSQDDLIEMIRQRRIEAQGYEAHLHTFNMWQMYVCTYKPTSGMAPHERVWKTLEDMKYNEDSGVIMQVRQVFEDLERGLARTRMGKESSPQTNG